MTLGWKRWSARVSNIQVPKVKVLEYKHCRDGLAFINFEAPAV